MATHYGVTPAKIVESGSGLYGKRYNGYFADNFTFFDTATEHGDDGVFSSISNFSSSPNNDNTVENYSWLWLGYFLAPTNGSYTFYTSSDDASWLWLGNGIKNNTTSSTAVVNNGGLHGTRERSGTIFLRSGKLYPMKIMFGENGGGDRMTVSFSGPGIAKTTNGSGYYYGGQYLWNALIGS